MLTSGTGQVVSFQIFLNVTRNHPTGSDSLHAIDIVGITGLADDLLLLSLRSVTGSVQTGIGTQIKVFERLTACSIIFGVLSIMRVKFRDAMFQRNAISGVSESPS